ncbi:MAG: hypothetical protein AB8F74_02555 [Saprospiraceae bacterium]
MNFFKKLFSKQPAKGSLNVRFGRFTDAYKTEQQYDAWDQAVQLFEKEEYLNAYEAFFNYLRDEKEDNVKVERNKGVLTFEFYQGSRVISGIATEQKVRAVAKVAKAGAFHMLLMKRLLMQNFDLKFSRFCLDEENDIAITFDTYSVDGSPYKLYYALKELATHADKQDDLLLDEFQGLESVENSPVTHLPSAEKEAKYKYIQKLLTATIDEVENGKLDKKAYSGGVAYILLDLVYKLDFLVCPEGFMMEALERIHRLYFSKNEMPKVEKNLILVNELKKLKERSKEEYFKEMYTAVSTFGITTAVNYSRVVHFIEGELPNMNWYNKNGYDKVACAIPGYIVGYCLFNYAVPEPCKDFFRLYYQVVESNYFTALGYERLYQPKQNKFDKRAIKKKIDAIADAYSPWFESLEPNNKLLNFESKTTFSYSFLEMMKELDLTKTG